MRPFPLRSHASRPYDPCPLFALCALLLVLTQMLSPTTASHSVPTSSVASCAHAVVQFEHTETALRGTLAVLTASAPPTTRWTHVAPWARSALFLGFLEFLPTYTAASAFLLHKARLHTLLHGTPCGAEATRGTHKVLLRRLMAWSTDLRTRYPIAHARVRHVHLRADRAWPAMNVTQLTQRYRTALQYLHASYTKLHEFDLLMRTVNATLVRYQQQQQQLSSYEGVHVPEHVLPLREKFETYVYKNLMALATIAEQVERDASARPWLHAEVAFMQELLVHYETHIYHFFFAHSFRAGEALVDRLFGCFNLESLFARLEGPAMLKYKYYIHSEKDAQVCIEKLQRGLFSTCKEDGKLKADCPTLKDSTGGPRM